MARIAVLEARVAALDYLLVAFPPLPAGWVWSASAISTAGEVFNNADNTWNAQGPRRDPDLDLAADKPTVYEAIASLVPPEIE